MKRLIPFALLLAVAFPAAAYKQVVHRILTAHAWNRALPNLDLRNHLGIDPNAKIDGRLPRQWAEEGVDDEDDFTNALNHFYDPRHDAPLTVKPLCNGVGDTAPDRALSGSSLGGASIGAVNNAYLFALIGMSAEQRKDSAKRLFLTLGHNIHLIQDMAQPEHTRNDQHLFPLFGPVSASIYEEWGLTNLLGSNPSVSYHGYPTLKFPQYRDYWHTDDTAMGFPAGKGLADFANNNFVTQDTNYSDLTDKCFTYTLPMLPADPGAVRTEVTPEAVWLGGIQVAMPVESKIYTSAVADHATNTSDSDPFHTFYSSLDHETRHRGADVYSLGDGSYLTRASMLIPRAVGYSAGILERVFRGKIEVKFTPDPAVANVYDMKITNRSEEAIGTDARLYSYYIFREYPTSPMDTHGIKLGMLDDLIPGFSGIPPGGSVTIEDVAPSLPPGKTLDDFEKRIAIEATLGTGEAVIGLVQPPSGTPVFVKVRTHVGAYGPNPPPIPSTMQVQIYIAAPGAATLQRVDGTWSADGQSMTASTRIPDGGSYRILTFHQTFVIAPHAFLVSVAKNEQSIDHVFSEHLIDRYGIGLRHEEFGVSQCLPVTATASPLLTPPGWFIQNQPRGACGLQFYLAGHPYEP